MAKAKRYDDGGDVREGKHSGIDDDTRARAMKFVRDNESKSSEEKDTAGLDSLVKRASASKPAKPARKRVTDTGDESERMAKRSASSRADKGYTETGEETVNDIPIGRRFVGPPNPKERSNRVENDSEVVRNLKNTAAALTPMGGGMARAAGRGLGALGSAASKGLSAGKSEAAAARKMSEDMAKYWPAGKKGGKVSAYAGGGRVASRGDGIAKSGRTRGKLI